MKSLSVFFPAHNEAENIYDMVNDTITFLDSIDIDYEVLVINDHSNDKTADIVKKHFGDNSKVRLIENDGIGGYGSALKKGFKMSKKETIFFTDSDRQFDIKELRKFLKNIDKYDYIIGYRLDRQDPFYRSINANAYKMLVRMLLGVHVKDLDCAFKLFNKEVIKSIEIKSDGALINAEILYKLKLKGYSNFKQIGVHHYPRKYGKPTGADMKVILRMFSELFKLKLNKLGV